MLKELRDIANNPAVAELDYSQTAILGASRSGVATTAALRCPLDRESASRRGCCRRFFRLDGA